MAALAPLWDLQKPQSEVALLYLLRDEAQSKEEHVVFKWVWWQCQGANAEVGAHFQPPTPGATKGY